jgi:hypothetical protein
VRVDLGSAGANVRVIRLADRALYRRAMNDCLYDLFVHFPTPSSP